MQKDMHFYMTYAMARLIEIDCETAKLIAWADQYTDEMTEAELYGIQTQSALTGNWSERQVQFSVLVPFHFLPGDDEKHKWKTTENCSCAQILVEKAKGDYIRFGIALHALQDTFSHQGFSGWQEGIEFLFSMVSCHKRASKCWTC